MKNTIFLLGIISTILACNFENSNTSKNKSMNETLESKDTSTKNDTNFGEKFVEKSVLNKNEMLALYKTLSIGDTIHVQYKSKVKNVCTKKGCWMNLELTNDKLTHVTFKDYGFFVPKDSKDNIMHVKGKAFVEYTDVKTLKHYAEDAGENQEQIAKINTPKLKYKFIADGVKVIN